MARIGWREITQRFSHIDAHFVRCEIGLPSNDGFFTVDLYPWWEHPLYLKVQEEGVRWGFANSWQGAKEVTVYPKNVHQFLLSRQETVIDWDFTRQHPLLWDYEWSGSIVCLSPLPPEVWRQIAALAQEALTGYNREANVVEYAARQVEQWGPARSFALGSFPLPLYQVLLPILDAHGIRCFLPSEPTPPSVPLPVLFLIDGGDYIIADDFEIDVPEFIHNPEWFQPRASDGQE